MTQTVVVTGASAGLGRAIANRFARDGARVALIARASARLDAAAREVEALGGEALALPLDVADAEAMEQAAAAVAARWGAIDVWVNNAMTSVFSPVKEMSAQEFKRVTEVTYLGVVNGTLAALKRMLPRNQGVIVQVGSALAYRAIPVQSAYCAGKHAVKAFTESLRCELLYDKSQVKITIVHMPALNTPHFNWAKTRLPRKLQPVPPIYQPELAAETIHWAAHHPRREYYFGASTQRAVWANKFFPGLIDRYLAYKGYDIQQYNGAQAPDHRDNLWESVPLMRAAHGDFDARAKTRSLQWFFARLPAGLPLLGVLALLAALLWYWAR